jgi:hypothetical protein
MTMVCGSSAPAPHLGGLGFVQIESHVSSDRHFDAVGFSRVSEGRAVGDHRRAASSDHFDIPSPRDELILHVKSRLLRCPPRPHQITSTSSPITLPSASVTPRLAGATAALQVKIAGTNFLPAGASEAGQQRQ